MTQIPPKGFNTVNPYLLVEDIDSLLDFLKSAFDAEVVESIKMRDGSSVHAEAKIGDSMIMMGKAHGEHKPISCMLYMYVENCDAIYQKAIAAGGKSIMEPADMFYGDRHGGVLGPQGNTWWIATRVEEVSSDELQRRSMEVEDAQKQQ